jgi:hypothetical protein
MRRFFAGARDAGIDEEGYRDRLEREFNTRSLRQLRDDQLERAAGMFPVKQKANFPHTRKVKALWIALSNLGAAERTDAALDAFVSRQTGKPRLSFLTATESNSVTEALKDMLAREGFVIPKGDNSAVRRALLLAQWTKLAKIGVVRIEGLYALNAWLDRTFQLCHGGNQDMTVDQLDVASKKLGSWIRSALKKKDAAA